MRKGRAFGKAEFLGKPKTQSDFEPGNDYSVTTVRGTAKNDFVIVVTGEAGTHQLSLFPRQCCDFGEKGMEYEDARYFRVDPLYQGVVHFYSNSIYDQLPQVVKKETARISLPEEPPRTTSQEPSGLGFLAKVAEWEKKDAEDDGGLLDATIGDK